MNPLLAIGAVALGGAAGSVVRYLLATWFVTRLGPGFPWGTFTINVSGSFIIGVVLQAAAARPEVSPYFRLLAATGFLGGYTTFSTFAYETMMLSADAVPLGAVAYAGGSVLLGVLAAYLGVVFVRLLHP